jgi:hypothetical protein
VENIITMGVAKGGGQVGPAHPRILLAHPRIKVKHIKNNIHLQYLSIVCLWFKIWPTPAKNHCYALDYNYMFSKLFYVRRIYLNWEIKCKTLA